MDTSEITKLFNDDKTIYIFDVDGVLASIEYGKYNHYKITEDDKWAKYVLENDVYKNVKPLSIMQKFLQTKNKDQVYVATRVMNEEETNQKKAFLSKYYQINPQHVYGITKNAEKLTVIKNIQKNYPQLENYQFVMIDDTVEILDYIENNSSYSTVHISSFLK